MEITITRTTTPKEKPDQTKLGFGNYFTDHMFVCEYETGKGWYNARIEPYGPIGFEPATVVFHYGQEWFEGLKGYKTADGGIQLFRPYMNAERAASSSRRLCMPEFPVEDFVEACKQLIIVDQDWIPTEPGTSMYIRPFMIADEPFLGVRPSNHYKFFVILSPVGSYYDGGMQPTKLYVEDKFVRSVRGGTGAIKCGGNYGCGLQAQEEAHQAGYEQILWLDGIERKYIEEIGTSNAFFMIDDEVITAPLDAGTILPGITRNTVIALLKEMGVKITERKITIDEVYEAAKTGHLTEVFASGTAAVISPVGHLCYKGEIIDIHEGKIGDLAQKLYDTITGIQGGVLEDTHGWCEKVL